MSTEEATADPPEPASTHPKDAWIPHVVPFIAWIFLMQMLGDPAGWKYALRSVVCLGIFIYLRPWQYDYPRLNLKNVPAAVGIGVFVFAFWVFFETNWFSQFPRLQKGYFLLFMQPPWEVWEPVEELYYAPETCGWPFTITRILGSALVISFIEEFFWRGWMYRWSIKENFLDADLSEFHWKPFLFVALMFGLIHHRWLAGLLCGVVYGLFVIRTRDVWAAGIAHAVTNFLLGVYVVYADKWQFWS